MTRLKISLFLMLVPDFAGVGIVVPLLPFFARSVGASPSAIASLIGLFPLAQAIGSLALGLASQRLGRLFVIRAALVLAALSYLVMGIPGTLFAVFFGRALGGIAGGKVGVVQALITEHTDERDRASHMAVIGAAFGVGMILGPVLGGFAAGSDPLHPHVMGVFLAAAALSSAGLAATFVWGPSQPAGQPAQTAPRIQTKVGICEFLRFCGRPHQSSALFVTALYGLCTSSMIALMPLWLMTRFGWGAREAGYVYAMVGLAMTAAQLGLVSFASHRFGDFFASAIGLAVLAFAAPLVQMASSLVSLLAAIGVFACGAGLAFATLKSLISKLFPTDWAGISMGANFALLSVFQFLGPVWTGLLFSHAGNETPFVLITITASLGSALCVWLGLSMKYRVSPET